MHALQVSWVGRPFRQVLPEKEFGSTETRIQITMKGLDPGWRWTETFSSMGLGDSKEEPVILIRVFGKKKPQRH